MQDTGGQTDYLRAFAGLDQRPQAPEGRFRDMRNMSMQEHPAISTRPKRRLVRTLSAPGALFCRDNKLGWVDGTQLWYEGVMRGSVSPGVKQIVQMGAWVLIWPDKLRYSTVDHTLTPLEQDITLNVQASKSLLDGSPVPSGADSPFCKLSAAGIGSGFRQGDTVSLSGHAKLTGDFRLETVAPDFLVVIAGADGVTAPITLRRLLPDMDFICEHQNRLWGCKGHEVYASKLGDPSNFRVYQRLSTDSYAATVGTAGAFTGMRSHLGYLLFFKEQVIHKLFGSKPSNFDLQSNAARGVAIGSHNSLCVVGETLYYLGPNGVMSYDGALPESVSGALHGSRYREAAAGALDRRLYLSMRDEAGHVQQLVYDTRLNMWTREDGLDVLQYASAGNTLYALCRDGGLWAIGEGSEGTPEDGLEWMLESSDLGLDSPLNKYISKLILRLQMEAGSRARLWLQRDGGAWEDKGEIQGVGGMRSHDFIVIPGRCDHFRWRLTGAGQISVVSVSKTIEQATER